MYQSLFYQKNCEFKLWHTIPSIRCIQISLYSNKKNVNSNYGIPLIDPMYPLFFRQTTHKTEKESSQSSSQRQDHSIHDPVKDSLLIFANEIKLKRLYLPFKEAFLNKF